MSEYISQLQKLSKVSNEVIGEGVYAMAGVVADSIREKLEALPTVTDQKNIISYRKGEKTHLSVTEKEGLLKGFGISPMRTDDGFVNVKLGFDGYNNVKTEAYPQGQPNSLIARITESGSSYRDKTPFIRKGINASKERALNEAKSVIDRKINAITKKG